MGQIVIDRESNLFGCLAIHNVFLNKIRIGNIANGKIETFDIPEGTHEIYAKNGRYKSNILKLNFSEKTIYRIKMKATITKLSGIKLEIIEVIEKSNLMKKYEEIEKLNNLKEKKIISEEEFIKEKKNLLEKE